MLGPSYPDKFWSTSSAMREMDSSSLLRERAEEAKDLAHGAPGAGHQEHDDGIDTQRQLVRVFSLVARPEADYPTDEEHELQLTHERLLGVYARWTEYDIPLLVDAEYACAGAASRRLLHLRGRTRV